MEYDFLEDVEQDIARYEAFLQTQMSQHSSESYCDPDKITHVLEANSSPVSCDSGKQYEPQSCGSLSGSSHLNTSDTACSYRPNETIHQADSFPIASTSFSERPVNSQGKHEDPEHNLVDKLGVVVTENTYFFADQYPQNQKKKKKTKHGFIKKSSFDQLTPKKPDTEHKRIKKTKDIIRAEVLAERFKECTFRPSILTSYVSKGDHIRGVSRSNALYNLHSRTEKARLAKIAEQEHMKEQTERNNTVALSAAQQQVVSDRLFKTKTKSKQQSNKKEPDPSFTFTPALCSKSRQVIKSSKSYLPIYGRIGELQKQSEAKLQSLQAKLQEKCNADLTFQPKTNSSKQHKNCKSHKTQHSSVVERLYFSQSNNTAHKLQDVAKIPECSFQPTINPVSRMIMQLADNLTEAPSTSTISESAGSDTTHYGDKKTSSKGQKAVGKRQKKQSVTERLYPSQLSNTTCKLNNATNATHGECSFKPTINPVSRIIANAAQLAQEDSTDVDTMFERLAYGDAQKKKHRHSILSDEYYERFTFQPSINNHSRKLVQANSNNQAINQKVHTTQLVRLKTEVEREFQKNHTFQPKISKKSKQIAKQINNNPENISQYIGQFYREKQRKLAERKKELHKDELQGCTFQPDMPTRRKPVVKKSQQLLNANEYVQAANRGYNKLQTTHATGNQSKSVGINGLDRFFQLKDIAHRKHESQKETEDKLFYRSMHNKPSLRTSIAHPKPSNSERNTSNHDRERRQTEFQTEFQTELYNNLTESDVRLKEAVHGVLNPELNIKN